MVSDRLKTHREILLEVLPKFQDLVEKMDDQGEQTNFQVPVDGERVLITVRRAKWTD
jgi:hypothetical protein